MKKGTLGAGNSATESQPRRIAVRIAVTAAVLAWLGGVTLGFETLWAYKSTPGESAVAPARWPGSKQIAPIAGQSTLLMFVHPLCSCTRASLAELDSILQRSGGRVAAWVLFLNPGGATADWTQSATWDAARRIRGVHVIADRDGVEAERFGAATSGQVVLYDAQGTLQFSGGITGARGHVGANAGERRVIELVNTGTAEAHDHAVFGCSLHDPHPRTDTSEDGST
jgi:hypothetical protein